MKKYKTRGDSIFNFDDLQGYASDQEIYTSAQILIYDKWMECQQNHGKTLYIQFTVTRLVFCHTKQYISSQLHLYGVIRIKCKDDASDAHKLFRILLQKCFILAWLDYLQIDFLIISAWKFK